MDTQNDGLEKVAPFKMAIVGIYVTFWSVPSLKLI